MTEEEVRTASDGILRRMLADRGYDRVEVIAALDHDDLPALFITAVLKPRSPLVRGADFSAVLTDISQMLLERGERRFPYLQLSHPDDERSEDDWRREAS